jgi:hypothetical protein
MRHILFTLKGCPYGLLDDEAHIRMLPRCLRVHYLVFNPISFNLKESLLSLYLQSPISLSTHGLRMVWQYVTCSHVVNKQTQGLVQHICTRQWVQLILFLKSSTDLCNEYLRH